MARKDRKKIEKKAVKKIDRTPGQAIRQTRESLGWRAVELSRRSGVNPRTLDAIEKGRIRSPSLHNLKSLTNALGVSMASLFTDECESERFFLGGNQKGQHILEFQKQGFRIVCYTPMVPHFFAGKVILKPETKIEHTTLPTSGMILVQVIMGKLAVHFEGKEHVIKEGNYGFFDGCFHHYFRNPHSKECTFLLVTAPSFLSPASGKNGLSKRPNVPSM